MSFISLTKVLPAVLACVAERFDALVMVKPQFEVGRERIGKGGVVRDPALRREALVAVAAAARAAGAAVLGLRAPPGCRGRPGNRETFAWLAEAGRAGRGGGPRGRGARGRAVSRVASVLTHRRATDTAGAVRALIGAARRADVMLRFDPEETRKHELGRARGIELDARALARRRPVHRHGRRRHDPHRAARTTRGRASRCSP